MDHPHHYDGLRDGVACICSTWGTPAAHKRAILADDAGRKAIEAFIADGNVEAVRSVLWLCRSQTYRTERGITDADVARWTAFVTDDRGDAAHSEHASGPEGAGAGGHAFPEPFEYTGDSRPAWDRRED